MDLGVYIHFPWCRLRCPYCDFAIAVAPLDEIPHDRYADAVLAELAARAPRFASPARTLISTYIGGGTPALWRPDAIARVLAAVQAEWGAAGEITVEANPNDCTPERLEALRAAGVNRLSIGAQSFDAPALVQLGRDHDAAQSLGAVAAARGAGFDNVSLDLIFALPGRDLGWWTHTLDAAIAVAPDHLSVYQLTVEPRTTYGEALRRGKLTPATDDACAEQFEAAHERLSAAGYHHYEVSSYARPGRESRHNGLYWRGAEYLGLGCAAHSFLRDGDAALRWSSHRSVVRYLAEADRRREAPVPADAPLELDPLVAEVIPQDAAAVAEDLVWLGLRTAAGIQRSAVPDAAAARVDRLVAAGLLEPAPGDRLRPTAKGLLFADCLGATLLE